MAKRDRYSRWRRLPPVFRSGEHKLPGPGDELERIILYLKGNILDQAAAQADKAGIPTLQEYCAEMLARAIEIERVKQHAAEIETRRGPLEGLNEISDDPEYLAEWQRRFDSGAIRVIQPRPATETGRDGNQELTVPLEARELATLPEVPDSLLNHLAEFGEGEPPGEPVEKTARQEPRSPGITKGHSDEADSSAPVPDPDPEAIEAEETANPPQVRIEIARDRGEPTVREPERIVPEVLDRTAAETVFVHVEPGDRDPDAFLPCLRRGQGVGPGKLDELLSALGRIEADQRGATMLDRHLSYALYRLALESQVLITEVWPGVFDDRNISAVRAVQEMVERILAGEEIRSEQAEQTESWEEDR